MDGCTVLYYITLLILLKSKITTFLVNIKKKKKIGTLELEFITFDITNTTNT